MKGRNRRVSHGPGIILQAQGIRRQVQGITVCNQSVGYIKVKDFYEVLSLGVSVLVAAGLCVELMAATPL